jgi:hypothetical protein
MPQSYSVFSSKLIDLSCTKCAINGKYDTSDE